MSGGQTGGEIGNGQNGRAYVDREINSGEADYSISHVHFVRLVFMVFFVSLYEPNYFLLFTMAFDIKKDGM